MSKNSSCITLSYLIAVDTNQLLCLLNRSVNFPFLAIIVLNKLNLWYIVPYVWISTCHLSQKIVLSHKLSKKCAFSKILLKYSGGLIMINKWQSLPSHWLIIISIGSTVVTSKNKQSRLRMMTVKFLRLSSRELSSSGSTRSGKQNPRPRTMNIHINAFLPVRINVVGTRQNVPRQRSHEQKTMTNSTVNWYLVTLVCGSF